MELKSPPCKIRGVMTPLGHPELSMTLRRNLQLAQQDLSWEHEENILQDLFAHTLEGS
jgi:hypothetical protein